MRSFISLLLLFGLYNYGFSQNMDEPIGMDESYGLQISIKKKLITARSGCGTSSLRGNRGTLYQIEVLDVLWQRDSSVYSLDEIANIEFLVVPSNMKFTDEMTPAIIAANSSSDRYLVFTRKFDHNSIIKVGPKERSHMFIGLTKCYKWSLFGKIAFWLGRNPEKLNKKLRNEQKRNPFLRHILKTDSI